MLLSSTVKAASCIPVQIFLWTKGIIFLYTLLPVQLLFPANCSFSAPGCSVFLSTSWSEITLSCIWTFSLKSQLYILAWTHMQILCDYYQKVSLNHLILPILFVLFVACKLFRAATASCYTQNLHPALEQQALLELRHIPCPEERAVAEGKQRRAWSVIFSFLNSAAFTPVSSVFPPNSNLHPPTQHWKVRRSSSKLSSAAWEKAQSPVFN